MVIEGRHGRKLNGLQSWLVFGIAAGMSIYQLYYLTYGVIDPFIFRAGHLAFAMVLIFLICPTGSSGKMDGFSALDALFAILSAGIFFYILFNYRGLVERAGVDPTTWDLVAASTAIVLILEGARRYFGAVLPLVAVAFLAYAYFGHFIPGSFGLPPFHASEIVSYVFSTTGIYGVAIATSATYVFLFVLFGTFLLHTGVGEVFMQVAMAAAGGVRGGPAKVAVISSALFGSISGSASSNVVTTGAFTIPLMKRIGYRGDFAAGVETASSIGGLFLPPIMGAGGFLMADILQVPYWEIVKAAAVPAILYYVVIFMLVDFEAVKTNLKGLPRSELPSLTRVLKTSSHLLIPIVVLLVALLELRVSPVRAGVYSIVSTIVVSWVRPETRVGIRKLGIILSDGARQALNVAVATGAAGIIVGIVQMTGLGLTFSGSMIDLAGTSMLLALIIAMIVAVIMGMGLPITATYITVAAVLAPALIKIGVQPIAANLFLYFFAAVSGMTPPVCVTAFAAAGVSGEEPMRVGWQALRLGWAAYVLPFMFVFGTPLLLMGSLAATATAVVTGLIGCFALGAAVHGTLGRKLNPWMRLLFGAGGLALVDVGSVSDIFGFGLLAVAFLWYRFAPSQVAQ